MIIAVTIELLLLSYFLYVVLYTATLTFASYWYKPLPVFPTYHKLQFAIIIPAYKEDNVIIEAASSAIKQTYPSDCYDIIIVADSLKPETLTQLHLLPVKILEVNFDISTKVKSLNHALLHLEPVYNHVVILDADNIMEKDFLQRINEAHQLGYPVVQGQRVPKNMNNTLAFLDGVSEAINNTIFRKGTCALGGSASINGSGTSYDFHALKETLATMNSIGGFDRELELLLLAKGLYVYYHEKAIVLDEKVQQPHIFENQRRRWIFSQYHYLKKYFHKGMRALMRQRFCYFNSAILRNIQLPRLVNIGLLTILTLLFYFVQATMVAYWIWPLMWGLLLVSICAAIPAHYYHKRLLHSVYMLPMIFVRMVRLLFNLERARKRFLHTPHFPVTENQVK